MNNNVLYDALMPVRTSRLARNLIVEPDESRISYVDFEILISRYANSLMNVGIKPDDHVMLQLNKSIEFIALYLATIRVGAVFIPINTAYVTKEVAYFLTDALPKLFICEDSKIQQYQEDLVSEGTQFFSLNSAGLGTWTDISCEQIATFETITREPDDIAAILYTSGTTGRSKGAMLTHNNLLSNAKQLINLWQFDANDILLHALPIYHTHGLFVAINLVLLSSCSMIFLAKFNATEVCHYLPKSTVMMGVPTFYSRLMTDERFNKQQCCSMRLFTSGSAPLLASDHEKFLEKTGHVILERYGMTETNMISSNPYYGERKAGTVGLAIDGVKVRIMSETTHSKVSTGEIGLIQVKGPNVFKGYWKMPDKTKAEFTEDGFFITGDLGEIDSQGYLSIVGRDKDMIISGGLNVYPIEVETIINDCEGVLESAVIGVKDADLGERVVAIVATDLANIEIEQNQILEQTINEATHLHLAGFKRPKQIFYVEKLPRNTMSKVQKSQLREQFSR